MRYREFLGEMRLFDFCIVVSLVVFGAEKC